MDTIVVLMSTYNGQKYVMQQIDSILKQKNVTVKLLIRDDGSTDGTKELLEKVDKVNDNVTVQYGNNVGWRQSFANLIMDAGEYDYYAFADQDDYWMEDKLACAINAIRSYNDIPCAYRGRSIISDGELNPSDSIFPKGLPISPTRALFQNYCQGCTMVFNRRLRDLYVEHPISVSSHDVWLPLIALHTGIIVDDPHPHMFYRVHASNATAGKTFIQTLRKRIKVVKKQSDSVYHYNYGKVLYNDYRELLNGESLKICQQMSEYDMSLLTKIKLLLNPEVRGNTILRTLLVKYFIITNSYRSDI